MLKVTMEMSQKAEQVVWNRINDLSLISHKSSRYPVPYPLLLMIVYLYCINKNPLLTYTATLLISRESTLRYCI